MREYAVVRDAIQKLGAVVTEEHLQPEVFGSAYCVFKGENHSYFRWVWDGKEGYGFLQTTKLPENWQDVGPRIHGISNLKSPKLLELLTIAKVLLNGENTA